MCWWKRGVGKGRTKRSNTILMSFSIFYFCLPCCWRIHEKALNAVQVLDSPSTFAKYVSSRFFYPHTPKELPYTRQRIGMRELLFNPLLRGMEQTKTFGRFLFQSSDLFSIQARYASLIVGFKQARQAFITVASPQRCSVICTQTHKSRHLRQRFSMSDFQESQHLNALTRFGLRKAPFKV